MRYWSPTRQGMLWLNVFAFLAIGVDFLILPRPALAGLLAVALVGILIQVLPFASTSAWLRAFVGAPRWYRVFDQVCPRFRFVDFQRALTEVAKRAQAHEWIEEHFPQQQTLSMLLRPGFFLPSQRADRQRLATGHNSYDFFATEIFCLLVGPEGLPADARLIVRLVQRHYGDQLEVAAAHADQAAHVMEQLNRLAAEYSIYRGHFLEVRPALTGQPGDLGVKFKERPRITDKDIVLDERIHGILRRTLFDFFRHRANLQALGLPKKRTLLLYGPPGTGKTHTCRFAQTMLDNITTIQVAGQAVTMLSDVGKFARQLHPSLVILEDIDLVFSQREINAYGTVLGELMDQLDGFTEDEEVLFILTTNAIERVEQAIRERPGRVNQCLYFGLPVGELRRLFLERYLTPYARNGLDLDHLVRQTERTSQAFLKEYVQRAVQVAAADVSYDKERLQLETRHFDIAFDELTSHGDPFGHSIMGFHQKLP